MALKYVHPRVEEVEMFGEEVAKVFGRLEVVRTGMNGVARAVGKPRNSKAVRTAIAYVEAGGSTCRSEADICKHVIKQRW